MMTKPGLCCEKCFEHIAKKNASAATIWLDLCLLQMQSDVFGIRTQGHKHLRLLELQGYLVTTDTPEVLIIKMLGKAYDEKGAYFCPRKCDEP